MTTYVETAGRAAPVGRHITPLLWMLWSHPRVRAWLEAVPRQQRLKRLVFAGRLWECATRWAMRRLMDPDIDPGLMEKLCEAIDPAPFQLSAVAPPPEIERLVIEIGAQNGYDIARCQVTDEAVFELLHNDWPKSELWHREMQAWITAP